jgi:hypothetical protein
MDSAPDAAGAAALSVCESLLLSLLERGVIDEAELRGILSDAAEFHREASRSGRNSLLHREAAELIERMRLRTFSQDGNGSQN